MRALAYAIAMEIAPVCNLSVRTHAATSGAVSADDWVRHCMVPGLAAFEAMLTGAPGGAGRYCHCDTVTLADICLVPQILNAGRLGLDPAAWPRITKVMAALQAIPAIAAAHADRHQPA